MSLLGALLSTFLLSVYADITSLLTWLLRRGQPHYFRIQGEDFVFELDAAQEEGNHVHTVWRDRNGDFGAGALERHYERHDH